MNWLILVLTSALITAGSSALAAVPPWKMTQANQVLQRIGAAYGFDLLKLPKLVIYPRHKNNKNIAHLELVSTLVKGGISNLDRSRLIMDEELFDACSAMNQDSSNALAFVISHEMAHFYLKHATFRSFAQENGATMPELVSSQQEKEADQKGLLFAFLAGYDPGPVLSVLLDKLYSQYGLDNELKGYPSKLKRQQETSLRAQEFRTYAYLFAVGHALYCQDKFAEAARCFEYVYSRYPLKEAYNNFGVCRLQEVIRKAKKTNLSYFALPFEVDPRNRLLRMGERSESPDATAVSTLLAEADEAFDWAIKLDNVYTAPYLNQALGSLLAGNPMLGMGVLEKLQRQVVLPANGYLIRGIAYWVYGDRIKADADFKKAVAQRAYQASYNHYIFQTVRQRNAQTIQQPWQRLLKQKPATTLLGCQTNALVLQEIDNAPAKISFNNILIEQSVPSPFIFVEYNETKTATYFRVKLGTPDSRTRQSILYFVQEKRPPKISR